MTRDDLEVAETEFAAAKEAASASPGDSALRVAYEEAAEAVRGARFAWRQQETEAGRRRGLVGGDARRRSPR